MHFITFDLLDKTVESRNNQYETGSLLCKSVAYIGTELVTLIAIPLALIEGVVRFILSFLLHPYVACVTGGREVVWYKDHFSTSLLKTILTVVAAAHISYSSINPFMQKITFTNESVLSYYPCLKIIMDTAIPPEPPALATDMVQLRSQLQEANQKVAAAQQKTEHLARWLNQLNRNGFIPVYQAS